MQQVSQFLGTYGASPARAVAYAAATAALFVAAACAPAPAPQTAAPAQTGTQMNTSDFMLTATLAEIMESIVMPSADALWNAVAVSVTTEGTFEEIPETDEEWEAVRWKAVNLAEATNLLVMRGRAVDAPGVVSESPEDELSPAHIKTLLDTQWPAWVAHAHALHEVAMQSITVIDAHDVDGLTEIGGAIDEACESCHLQFWYPEQ
jgi:hypothetical protein